MLDVISKSGPRSQNTSQECLVVACKTEQLYWKRECWLRLRGDAYCSLAGMRFQNNLVFL